MEVKDFSYEIILAVENSAEGRMFPFVYAPIVAITTTAISIFSTSQFYGNPIYHASGLVSYLTNKISDYYTSPRVRELTEDPRFKEYGIDKYVIEKNISLPGHPTKKEFFNTKQKIIQTLLLITSAILPGIGHGIGATTPIVYENNRAVYKRIKKAFEIGDEVKEKIEAGLSEEQIKRHLNELYMK